MDKLLIAKSEPLWNSDKRIISLIGSLIVLLFALPHFGLNSFYLHLMIMIFMHAVMAQSWNVIAGFSGQISLGHGAFFGIGAYATSFLYVQYGISPWIGIFVGIILSGLAAVLIGIPMLRLSGHYFAIATLLIGISFQIIFQRWEWVGAASGVWVPMTSGDSLLALQFHNSKMPYYYIFLIFFIITFFLVWLLSRSKLGYRLRAVRDDPQAALSLCINVSNYKIIAYVISAMIMAPMGSLFAQYILIIDPDRVFNIEISIIVLLITVLGGIGNVWGPIVGAAILIPISEYSRIYLGGTGGAVDLILYGLILMLICIFRPEGLISFFPKNILERKKQR
ncbi:branched-chain amino acid ABC transporter permease [Candidatus Pelagibacter sp.]|jgi:branched-chain amino acid transport system permease protein|nr:branched-chain amino acid ABC transporter permease [Candidatus Pelagibacter sp.]MDC1236358.1 branched-chain amino acid ABC transporter permease [Pelagibacteraceae bacterium]MDC6479266.1 branched-chain amino acid ABC transporter permease [Candidatus Pelagibacter sp.]